jgi:hypothetical protein
MKKYCEARGIDIETMSLDQMVEILMKGWAMLTTFFRSIKLEDCGWTVITPVITTLEGQEYRQHVAEFGFGGEGKRRADHMAKELNSVCGLTLYV